MNFLKTQDIAKMLDKSIKWVYAHAHELGGCKIGGTFIFTEEGFYNAIQRRQEMARKSNVQGKAVHSSTSKEKRGDRMGDRKAKGDKTKRRELASRAGLTDFL
jgi:hypothetical protein